MQGIQPIRRPSLPSSRGLPWNAWNYHHPKAVCTRQRMQTLGRGWGGGRKETAGVTTWMEQ